MTEPQPIASARERPRYFVLDGYTPVPIADVEAWCRRFEAQRDQHCVALTTIDGASISTMFLGLDHSWSEVGPPVLFETMVFDHPTLEGQCYRCATWDEALVQHDSAVAEVSNSDLGRAAP